MGVILNFDKLVNWCNAAKCELTCATPCTIEVCAMVKECIEQDCIVKSCSNEMVSALLVLIKDRLMPRIPKGETKSFLDEVEHLNASWAKQLC
jgi:hypothetical protein